MQTDEYNSVNHISQVEQNDAFLDQEKCAHNDSFEGPVRSIFLVKCNTYAYTHT